MRARNIIVSYGTFVPNLLYFTKYTNKIYTPSYFPVYHSNVMTIVITLTDHREQINKWLNTYQQRFLIINYKRFKIIFCIHK